MEIKKRPSVVTFLLVNEIICVKRPFNIFFFQNKISILGQWDSLAAITIIICFEMTKWRNFIVRCTKGLLSPGLGRSSRSQLTKTPQVPPVGLFDYDVVRINLSPFCVPKGSILSAMAGILMLWVVLIGLFTAARAALSASSLPGMFLCSGTQWNWMLIDCRKRLNVLFWIFLMMGIFPYSYNINILILIY